MLAVRYLHRQLTIVGRQMSDARVFAISGANRAYVLAVTTVVATGHAGLRSTASSLSRLRRGYHAVPAC